MSWSVFLYAEKKNVDGTWVPVVEHCLDMYFEGMLPVDDLSDCARLDEFARADVKTLSQYIRNNWNVDASSCDVRECAISEMYDKTRSFIERFEQDFGNVMKALGMKVSHCDDELYVHSDIYNDDGDLRKNANPLTFPVSKDLVEDMAGGLAMYGTCKALNGMLRVINEMAGMDSTVRLIMIGA